MKNPRKLGGENVTAAPTSDRGQPEQHVPALLPALRLLGQLLRGRHARRGGLRRRPASAAAETCTGGGGHRISPSRVTRDGPLHDVVHVEHQLPVLARGQQLEQVDQVRAVQLGGVRRHPAGQVGVADDRHPVVGDDLLARHGQLAVAAAGGREVDDHAARLHVRDHVGGDGDRRLPADQRGGDQDVRLGRLLRRTPGRSARPDPRSAPGRTRRRRPPADRRGADTNVAPIDSICSATSGRTSNARTWAPRLPAAPIAASPATPAPMTKTVAGWVFPAAVTCPAEHPAIGLRGLDHPAVPGDVATSWTARPSTAPGRSAESRPARSPVARLAFSAANSSG